MNTFKSIAAIIIVIVVGFLAVAVNYSWVSGCDLSGRGPNVHYTFSEFEEINGTGIYVSEVLKMNRGEMDKCSTDNKIQLVEIELYLFDNRGFTNFTEKLSSLQDNYAGNYEEKVDLSAEIANDNGTEFPIHFENQMDNDFEKYGESSDLRHDELYLSVGDKIKVYGSGSEANGPAENDWAVRIKFAPTSDSLTYDLLIP